MKKGMRALFTAAVVAMSSGMAFAQPPEGTYEHGWDWHGGWSGMFFGSLMMIVFVAVVVALVALAVRWIGGAHGGAHPGGPGTKSSIHIVEERFARGEIDKEEFEERRRALRE